MRYDLSFQLLCYLYLCLLFLGESAANAKFFFSHKAESYLLLEIRQPVTRVQTFRLLSVCCVFLGVACVRDCLADRHLEDSPVDMRVPHYCPVCFRLMYSCEPNKSRIFSGFQVQRTSGHFPTSLPPDKCHPCSHSGFALCMCC